MVLEKPVENLYREKQIPLRYCFAWANEPWTKTWHGAGGDREILLAQTYGGEEEWEQHYQYFRTFFLDSRYIKEGNRPVLLIYRLKNIPCFNAMIRYWNVCAKKDGFDGIFLISMNVCREPVEKSRWVNGSVDFEPNKTKSEQLANEASGMRPNPGRSLLWNRWAVKKLSYRKLNRRMLKTPHERNHFRTMFVDYDDSPRRQERAVITRGSRPRRFGKYLRRMMRLSEREGNEYLFVNAWNEWGEGNYLEPDSRYGYAYLEEVRKSVIGK